MSSEFPKFGTLVNQSFQRIAKSGKAFEVKISGEDLFAKYLAAFPEGTNLVFKTRTEHDCACCKHFIRRAGILVGVNADSTGLVTIWDEAAVQAPYPYNEVAVVLRDLVKAAEIGDLYRVNEKETSFGAQQTHSKKVDEDALTWNHFHTGEIPSALRPKLPDTVKGEHRSAVQVFERGLKELSPDAVGTVLEAMASNSIYRAAEHQNALTAFQRSQNEYIRRSERERHFFVWTTATGAASHFRNSVIGTLIQSLSEGKDLEASVRSFENMVAPQNYKRTTALITPGMIKTATEKIAELGLEPALERRFARIGDISVNDVKWVDNNVKPLMKGGIVDVLLQHAAKAVNTEADEKRAEEIGLEAFMSTVLPEATGMEVLFKGEHLGNLMSLTAPVHPEPKQLFKWNNDFAWSYRGGIADSIKERVKKAGGKVEGALMRVSLSWYNYDDLDLHIYEPSGRGTSSVRDHIYYGSKTGWTQGTLDVDMNAGGPRSREPVENVSWGIVPANGPYKVVVNNFNKREDKDVGFVIEVENNGKLSHFSFNKMVRHQQDVHVATLFVKGGVIEKVEVGDPGISASNISQEVWGLKTEQYVKVNAVTLSPNYWGDNATGNKHTFFLLEGAKNDEPTRGIYNEFLNTRLEPHRKVFEVIGEKTKCQPTEGQLSGIGFSSTKHESVIVKVSQGKKQRVFNVKTGA